MGFWSKWLGTEVAGGSVTPLPKAEVWDALVALNGPDAKYRVRNAQPTEKADLVAECHIPRVGLRLKISMRFVPDEHEVRFVQERWEDRSAGNANAQYGRGNAHAVFRQWERATGPDGRKQRVEVYRFDTREMTDPLQNMVLASGWTWRGALKF